MAEKTFTFREGWKDAIMALPDDVRLEVYDAIVGFAFGDNIEGLKPMAEVVLNFVKPQIQEEFRRKEAIALRNRINGSKHVGKKESEPSQSSSEQNPVEPSGTQTNPKNPVGYLGCQEKESAIVLSPTPPISLTKEKEKEKPPIGVKKKNNSELSLFGGAEAARTYNGVSIEYVADGFYPIFLKWLEYKKQRRESYKSERSLKTCYNQLVKYAEGSAAYADYIVDRSIANNWQGLFPLKQGDIDFLKKQSNGNARLEPNRAATVPRRTADDYDEEDD